MTVPAPEPFPPPTASAAPREASRPFDFRALRRKLEEALGGIERASTPEATLEALLTGLLDRFQHELGFEGGRIYRREGDHFYLDRGFGRSREAPVGLKVPPDYPPHVRTLEEGVVLMRRGDEGWDEGFERAIGVSDTFAAISVGEGPSHVVAFSIAGAPAEERVLVALTAVRHVVNLKLEQQRVAGMLEQSRLIQESILPAAPPVFPGFEIAGRSRPADWVGGDVYDWLPRPDGRLGVAIADASGHGLSAALLARDVVTGLRMGVRGTSALALLIGRLNQVVHRASLASTFISLFYAELGPDGELEFCNAGHNPPFLTRRGACEELVAGGTVLGPLPGARFESARARLDPGEMLVLYTDGVVEREGSGRGLFGERRLQAVILEQLAAGASAEGAVEAILAAITAYGGGLPARDDATVVVVRRG
jgi:sigma-B regulation protein RsbU (phosphoserine phosphatase)